MDERDNYISGKTTKIMENKAKIEAMIKKTKEL